VSLSAEEQAELDRLLVMPPDTLYQRDPIGWMVKTLGIPEWTIRWSMLPEYKDHVWDGTPDPLAAICEAVAEGRDVGVESATGTGKTFLGAGLALWYNACFEDSLVITTAPVEKQLKAQCWKEIGLHFAKYQQRYPMASMVDLRVRMREGAGAQERWAIIGYGCGVEADTESATRAQGFHAKDMLVVTEETPGVPSPVMTALANTRTGAHNHALALGNPNHQLDELHKFCIRPGTVHIRISALDHPNVVTGREMIPGATSRAFIARALAEYRTDTHPLYQSRVRGISPVMNPKGFFHPDDVKAGLERGLRPEQYEFAPIILSCDPAWEGDDELVIGKRQGLWYEILQVIPKNDNDFHVASILAQYEDQFAADGVVIDLGYGTGIYSAGKTMGRTGWHLVSFAEAAVDAGCLNKRAEMIKAARDWLKAGGCVSTKGPWADQLRVDLLSLETVPRPDGVLQFEAKKDMKKRGLKSPGQLDALALTFGRAIQKRTAKRQRAFAAADYHPHARLSR